MRRWLAALTAVVGMAILASPALASRPTREFSPFSNESYSGVCTFTVERQILANNSYLTTNPAVLNTLVANGQAAGKEVWLIANDAKAPKSTQWNVGVRRQLGDFLVSAAYVGARGHDQLVFNWANLLLNANGGCCVGGSFGHGFSNILYTTSSGKTWYDALQVQRIDKLAKVADRLLRAIFFRPLAFAVPR